MIKLNCEFISFNVADSVKKSTKNRNQEKILLTGYEDDKARLANVNNVLPTLHQARAYISEHEQTYAHSVCLKYIMNRLKLII